MLATLGQSEERDPGEATDMLLALLIVGGVSAGIGIFIGWLADRRSVRRKRRGKR